MKVPTIPTNRIATRIANFAFTFIVVLLLNLGKSCFGSSVASALTKASCMPNPSACRG